MTSLINFWVHATIKSEGGIFDEVHFEDISSTLICNPCSFHLALCLGSQNVGLGIRYREFNPRFARLSSFVPRQHDQWYHYLSDCLPRKSRGIADGGSLDDWTNAEVALFLAGYCLWVIDNSVQVGQN